MDVLALRDQVLRRLVALARRLDDDAALVLVVLAEPHRAGDLGDDRRVLRLARLEQLRHPRQTAGDVAGLGAFGRDTREHVAGLHLRAGLDREDRVDREHDSAPRRRAASLRILPCPLDHDRRTQVLLAAGRARAPVDDHALGDAGRLRRAASDIDSPSTRSSKSIDAVDFGEDRPV